MWDHERRTLPPTGGSTVVAVAAPSRINIAVNRSMLKAIDRIIETDEVSLTEAVRRLLCYGELVHDVQHTPGRKLIVRDERGGEREVVTL